MDPPTQHQDKNENSDVLPGSRQQASSGQALRGYQERLVELAKRRNAIACLGTGAGKTLIAIHLIKHVVESLRNERENHPVSSGLQQPTWFPCDSGNGLARPIPCPRPLRRLVVFVVPSVVLCEQQCRYIQLQTGIACDTLYGDKSPSSWSLTKFRRYLERYDVLCMTGGVLKNLLVSSKLTMNEIALLVLDECHQAKGNHDYCRIMEFYHARKKAIRENRPEAGTRLPKILGLTASPSNLAITQSENFDNEDGESQDEVKDLSTIKKQLEEIQGLLDSVIVAPSISEINNGSMYDDDDDDAGQHKGNHDYKREHVIEYELYMPYMLAKLALLDHAIPNPRNNRLELSDVTVSTNNSNNIDKNQDNYNSDFRASSSDIHSIAKSTPSLHALLPHIYPSTSASLTDSTSNGLTSPSSSSIVRADGGVSDADITYKDMLWESLHQDLLSRSDIYDTNDDVSDNNLKNAADISQGRNVNDRDVSNNVCERDELMGQRMASMVELDTFVDENNDKLIKLAQLLGELSHSNNTHNNFDINIGKTIESNSEGEKMYKGIVFVDRKAHCYLLYKLFQTSPLFTKARQYFQAGYLYGHGDVQDHFLKYRHSNDTMISPVKSDAKVMSYHTIGDTVASDEGDEVMEGGGEDRERSLCVDNRDDVDVDGNDNDVDIDGVDDPASSISNSYDMLMKTAPPNTLMTVPYQWHYRVFTPFDKEGAEANPLDKIDISRTSGYNKHKPINKINHNNTVNTTIQAIDTPNNSNTESKRILHGNATTSMNPGRKTRTSGSNGRNSDNISNSNTSNSDVCHKDDRYFFSGMTARDQETVLHSFKLGMINIIFATSVAEEGLDIHGCSFVIAYDGVSTLQQYIQRKGRARDKEASLYMFQPVLPRFLLDSTSICQKTCSQGVHNSAAPRLSCSSYGSSASDNDTSTLTNTSQYLSELDRIRARVSSWLPTNPTNQPIRPHFMSPFYEEHMVLLNWLYRCADKEEEKKENGAIYDADSRKADDFPRLDKTDANGDIDHGIATSMIRRLKRRFRVVNALTLAQQAEERTKVVIEETSKHRLSNSNNIHKCSSDDSSIDTYSEYRLDEDRNAKWKQHPDIAEVERNVDVDDVNIRTPDAVNEHSYNCGNTVYQCDSGDYMDKTDRIDRPICEGVEGKQDSRDSGTGMNETIVINSNPADPANLTSGSINTPYPDTTVHNTVNTAANTTPSTDTNSSSKGNSKDNNQNSDKNSKDNNRQPRNKPTLLPSYKSIAPYRLSLSSDALSAYLSLPRRIVLPTWAGPTPSSYKEEAWPTTLEDAQDVLCSKQWSVYFMRLVYVDPKGNLRNTAGASFSPSSSSFSSSTAILPSASNIIGNINQSRRRRRKRRGNRPPSHEVCDGSENITANLGDTHIGSDNNTSSTRSCRDTSDSPPLYIDLPVCLVTPYPIPDSVILTPMRLTPSLTLSLTEARDEVTERVKANYNRNNPTMNASSNRLDDDADDNDADRSTKASYNEHHHMHKDQANQEYSEALSTALSAISCNFHPKCFPGRFHDSFQYSSRLLGMGLDPSEKSVFCSVLEQFSSCFGSPMTDITSIPASSSLHLGYPLLSSGFYVPSRTPTSKSTEPLTSPSTIPLSNEERDKVGFKSYLFLPLTLPEDNEAYSLPTARLDPLVPQVTPSPSIQLPPTTPSLSPAVFLSHDPLLKRPVYSFSSISTSSLQSSSPHPSPRPYFIPSIDWNYIHRIASQSTISPDSLSSYQPSQSPSSLSSSFPSSTSHTTSSSKSSYTNLIAVACDDAVYIVDLTKQSPLPLTSVHDQKQSPKYISLDSGINCSSSSFSPPRTFSSPSSSPQSFIPFTSHTPFHQINPDHHIHKQYRLDIFQSVKDLAYLDPNQRGFAIRWREKALSLLQEQHDTLTNALNIMDRYLSNNNENTNNANSKSSHGKPSICTNSHGSTLVKQLSKEELRAVLAATVFCPDLRIHPSTKSSHSLSSTTVTTIPTPSLPVTSSMPDIGHPVTPPITDLVPSIHYYNRLSTMGNSGLFGDYKQRFIHFSQEHRHNGAQELEQQQGEAKQQQEMPQPTPSTSNPCITDPLLSLYIDPSSPLVYDSLLDDSFQSIMHHHQTILKELNDRLRFIILLQRSIRHSSVELSTGSSSSPAGNHIMLSISSTPWSSTSPLQPIASCSSPANAPLVSPIQYNTSTSPFIQLTSSLPPAYANIQLHSSLHPIHAPISSRLAYAESAPNLSFSSCTSSLISSSPLHTSTHSSLPSHPFAAETLIIGYRLLPPSYPWHIRSSINEDMTPPSILIGARESVIGDVKPIVTEEEDNDEDSDDDISNVYGDNESSASSIATAVSSRPPQRDDDSKAGQDPNMGEHRLRHSLSKGPAITSPWLSSTPTYLVPSKCRPLQLRAVDLYVSGILLLACEEIEASVRTSQLLEDIIGEKPNEDGDMTWNQCAPSPRYVLQPSTQPSLLVHSLFQQALTFNHVYPHELRSSYERLEVLGDAWLKFIVTTGLFFSPSYLDKDEGVLTSQKDKLIANNVIANKVKDTLIGYVRNNGFRPISLVKAAKCYNELLLSSSSSSSSRQWLPASLALDPIAMVHRYPEVVCPSGHDQMAMLRQRSKVFQEIRRNPYSKAASYSTEKPYYKDIQRKERVVNGREQVKLRADQAKQVKENEDVDISDVSLGGGVDDTAGDLDDSLSPLSTLPPLPIIQSVNIKEVISRLLHSISPSHCAKQINMKRLADVSEALLGCAVLISPQTAIQVLKRLSIIPEDILLPIQPIIPSCLPFPPHDHSHHNPNHGLHTSIYKWGQLFTIINNNNTLILRAQHKKSNLDSMASSSLAPLNPTAPPSSPASSSSLPSHPSTSPYTVDQSKYQHILAILPPSSYLRYYDPHSLSFIQRDIDYSFRWPLLLAVALTHPSAVTIHDTRTSSVKASLMYSYERLEFLGDSICDWLLLSYLQSLYPDALPDRLHYYKRQLTSASVQARVCILFGLHRVIRYNSLKMHNMITLFASTCMTAVMTGDRTLLDNIEPPKVLSDVVESVVGAVYVDSGGDLTACWTVIRTLFHGILPSR